MMLDAQSHNVTHSTAQTAVNTSHQLGGRAVSHVKYQWWLDQSSMLAGNQTSTKIKVSYIAHHSALISAKPSQIKHYS